MEQRATYKIPNTNCQIILEVCDLFAQSGLKVIHCLNTFDTNDGVIIPNSVMGQFIRKCKDKSFDLDTEIDKWIEKNKRKSIPVDALPYKKNIFNMGEICQIAIEKDTYLLAAFNDLRTYQDTGAMDLDSYLFFLDSLWLSLGRIGLDKTTINIPAFGNKIVNVASNRFAIDIKVSLIVQSYFKAMRKHLLFDNLKICIYESDAKNIDLSKWESAIFPYLYQYCQLPLGIKGLNSKQKGLYAGIKKTNYSFVSQFKNCSNKEVKQVFISHSKNDCQEADEIYKYLESHGYKCWMDTHNITPGLPYAKEIMKGFNESSAVVVVVSKNAMEAKGVINEIDNVYKRNKIIIPFRIDETPLSEDLSFYLSATQWINAFPNFEEHLEQLGEALKQLLWNGGHTP